MGLLERKGWNEFVMFKNFEVCLIRARDVVGEISHDGKFF